ncbi:hypothetical protein EJB05_54440, partial [Eragrostis curvula]
MEAKTVSSPWRSCRRLGSPYCGRNSASRVRVHEACNRHENVIVLGADGNLEYVFLGLEVQTESDVMGPVPDP